MLIWICFVFSLANLWIGISNKRKHEEILRAVAICCESIQYIQSDIDELEDAIFEESKLTFVPEPNDQGAN